MYKIKIVDPFYNEISTVNLPSIPSINECIALWYNGVLTEYDVKAVTYYLDKNNSFEYAEVCVEVGEGL